MALVGYARVSTQEQSLESQLESLESVGCSKIFYGKQSGKSEDNEKQLSRLIDYVREGDIVVLTKLDRMGRSLNRILSAIDLIQSKGAFVKTLDGQVDTSDSSPMKEAMTQLLGVFAQLEHSIITDRLQSGRERTGRKGGRKKKLCIEQRKSVQASAKKGISVSQLARDYGVSRMTIHRVLAE